MCGDVLRATEPDFALVECMRAENHCVLTKACRLRGPMERALAAFHAELSRHNATSQCGMKRETRVARRSDRLIPQDGAVGIDGGHAHGVILHHFVRYDVYAVEPGHVEAAMGLSIGGALEEAEAAYHWLRENQRPDGSWRNESPLQKEDEPLVATPFALQALVAALDDR